MERIALLFPGQGSQYPGMGKKFHLKYQIVKEIFEEASDVLGMDMRKLCFDDDMETITRTGNTQPALLTVSVAMFQVFMGQYDVKPAFCCGHSLGELSALTCSAAIKFGDALKIAKKRGELFEKAIAAGEGMMAAVNGVDVTDIEAVISRLSREEKYVSIACYNSPDQNVIAGSQEALKLAAQQLFDRGGNITFLKVSAPFHTRLMEPAADKLALELGKYQFITPKWPVISNVSAQPYHSGEEIPDMLVKQVVSPVKWRKIVDYLETCQVKTVIELGPRAVLSKLVNSTKKSMKAYAYDESEDRNNLKSEIHFIFNNDKCRSDEKSHSNQGMEFIRKCLAFAVCTQNANWNEAEYQKGVIDPVKQVKQLFYKLEVEKREPEPGELQTALQMVYSVFKTKQVSQAEQVQRLRRLTTRSLSQKIVENIAAMMNDLEHR